VFGANVKKMEEEQVHMSKRLEKAFDDSIIKQAEHDNFDQNLSQARR